VKTILEKSQLERNLAQFSLTDVTRAMLAIANECFGVWYSTNAALKARMTTKSQAKSQVERILHKLEQDIQALKSSIAEIESAVASKTALLQVRLLKTFLFNFNLPMSKRRVTYSLVFQETQTGLDSKKGHTGAELCHDTEIMSLLREMKVHRNVIDVLTKKLGELETQLEHLLKTKRTLERDLKLKAVAASDNEKCLSLRRTFPISTFQEARTAKSF